MEKNEIFVEGDTVFHIYKGKGVIVKAGPHYMVDVKFKTYPNIVEEVNMYEHPIDTIRWHTRPLPTGKEHYHHI